MAARFGGGMGGSNGRRMSNLGFLIKRKNNNNDSSHQKKTAINNAPQASSSNHKKNFMIKVKSNESQQSNTT